MTDQKKKLA